MQPVSIFGRKGLLLLRPPKLICRLDSVHKEYGIPLVFRNRVEGLRSFDKNNEISAIFTAKHLTHFLINGLNPQFSLDVPSHSPGHPVKLTVGRTEDDHISFVAVVRKDGKNLEASVETQVSDFKLMQILFERTIPKLVGWEPMNDEAAESPAVPAKSNTPEIPKPKPKPKSLADDFFSS